MFIIIVEIGFYPNTGAGLLVAGEMCSGLSSLDSCEFRETGLST